MSESLAQMAVTPSGTGERVALSRNFAWTLAGNVVYAACQWGILIAIAKLGTPAMVGQFALGLAVSAPVFMFTGLQLRTVLATDAGDEYRLGNYLALRILGTGIGLALILGFVLLSRFGRDTAIVVLLVSLAKAAETFSDILYGFWQKYERFDKITLALSGRGIASLAIVAGALYLTQNIALSTGAMALVWVLWFSAYECGRTKNLLASLSSHEKLRAEWDKEKCIQLVVLAWPLGIVILLLSLNANLPRYFIEHDLGEAALGYFAALAYEVVAGNTVVSAIGQSAVPRLARFFQTNRKAFWDLLKKMVVLSVVLGIAGVVLAFLFGAVLLKLLYRPDYAQHATVFSCLMVAAALAYVTSMLGYGMTAARLFRQQVPLFFATTAITTLACWTLIPSKGLIGGAYAVLIGSLVSCLGSACVILVSLRVRASSREA